MRKSLPNFFLEGKNTFSSNYKSIETFLEPYDQLSAQNETPYIFDFNVTIFNPKG